MLLKDHTVLTNTTTGNVIVIQTDDVPDYCRSNKETNFLGTAGFTQMKAMEFAVKLSRTGNPSEITINDLTKGDI